ncbi:MAG: hypothetical protein C0475_02465 [Planctomyces sp.]|nr:hypothetical protein [Planctomyces sp.]
MRHSFASVANDQGYTEITIAAIIGHSKVTMTSKYVYTLDTALVAAADTVAGFINELLRGRRMHRMIYGLDRISHKQALNNYLVMLNP